jgi:hypothetical protein
VIGFATSLKEKIKTEVLVFETRIIRLECENMARSKQFTKIMFWEANKNKTMLKRGTYSVKENINVDYQIV